MFFASTSKVARSSSTFQNVHRSCTLSLGGIQQALDLFIICWVGPLPGKWVGGCLGSPSLKMSDVILVMTKNWERGQPNSYDINQWYPMVSWCEILLHSPPVAWFGSTAKHQHLQPPPTTCWSRKFWDAFSRQESTCIYDLCFLQKKPSINDWKTRFPDGYFFKTLVTSPFYGQTKCTCHHRGFLRVLWICGFVANLISNINLVVRIGAAEALHLRNPRCGFATKTMKEVNTLRWRDSKIMMILFALVHPGIRHESPSLPAEGLNFTQGRLGKAQISKKTYCSETETIRILT